MCIRDRVETYGTDPNDRDSDDDGLSDGKEIDSYGSDPLDTDTDDDGLEDGEEVNETDTDPLDADTDDDGLTDGEEIEEYETDPNNSDTDGGGTSDGDEAANGTNPLDGADDVSALEGVFKGGNGLSCATAESSAAPSGWLMAALGALGLLIRRKR